MRPTSTPRRKIVSEESPVAGVAGAGACPDAREAIASSEQGARRYNCGGEHVHRITAARPCFQPNSIEHFTRAPAWSTGRIGGNCSFDGGDRRSFLQGLLTNDVQALEAGSGCYAALLTANGRMVADMRVFELGDDAADGRRHQSGGGAPRSVRSVDLQRGRPGRGRLTVARGSWVSTDRRPRRLSRTHFRAPSTSRPSRRCGSMRAAAWRRSAGSVIVARSDEIGVHGFDLFVPAASSDAIAADLRAAGATDIDVETAEVTRIEAGRPVFGDRHGRGHDSARSRDRGPRHQPDQRLLRRPGDHHPRVAPRPRTRGEAPRPG